MKNAEERKTLIRCVCYVQNVLIINVLVKQIMLNLYLL